MGHEVREVEGTHRHIELECKTLTDGDDGEQSARARA